MALWRPSLAAVMALIPAIVVPILGWLTQERTLPITATLPGLGQHCFPWLIAPPIAPNRTSCGHAGAIPLCALRVERLAEVETQNGLGTIVTQRAA